MVRPAHFARTTNESRMNATREPFRLAELIGALSLATDLGAGVPLESSLRPTVIAAGVGRSLGLAGAALADVYFTAAVRYLGCTGFAHEEAAMGAGDDLALLATYEAADPARLSEVIALTVRKLGRGAPLRARATAVVRFLADPAGYAKLARAHCDQAMALAGTLGLSAVVRGALGEIYERHDGRGAPQGLAAAAISLPARVLHVAQAAEIHHRLGGPAAVTRVL